MYTQKRINLSSLRIMTHLIQFSYFLADQSISLDFYSGLSAKDYC